MTTRTRVADVLPILSSPKRLTKLQEVAINTPTHPSLAANPARLKLDNYPIQFELPTRLSDVVDGNRIGLIGLARYYEEARMEFIGAIIGKERHHTGGWMAFVRKCHIEMLGDVTFPDTLTVGGGILHVGTTSYSYGFGVFQHGNCVSLSDAVGVWVDENGRPKAVGEDIKVLARQEILRS